MNSDNQKTMILLKKTTLVDKGSKAYKVYEIMEMAGGDLFGPEGYVSIVTEICNIFGCQYTEDQVRKIILEGPNG